LSVHVRLIGRLGNHMFQYAVGRLLSRHLGYQFACEESGHDIFEMWRGLNVGRPASLTKLRSWFPNARLIIPGKSYEAPIESYEIDKNPKWDGHVIDFPSIISDTRPRQIKLCGYFQRMEYILDHKDEVKQWYTIAPTITPFEVHPRDVIVSFRRDADFGIKGWTLPFAYYESALRALSSIDTTYVVGTGVDDQVRAHFRPYKPVFYDGDPIEQFAFMLRFRRIILSNSTFAWWAGFLSQAEEIYAPRSIGGAMYAFSGYGSVDLHMREQRYKEVNVETSQKFTLLRVNPGFLARSGSALPNSSLKHLKPHNELEVEHEAVWQWLRTQAEPFGLDDLKRVYGASDIYEFAKRLISLRIVVLEPTYYYDR
jgi:hypothetical protein